MCAVLSGKPHCVLIMGAGWSAAAGLPLANELFDRPRVEVSPPTLGDERVRKAFGRWRRAHPDLAVERFVAFAYEEKAADVVRISPRFDDIVSGQLVFDFALERMATGAQWSDVAAFLQRRLATPTGLTRHRGQLPRESELRYRPALLRRSPAPEHGAFWESLLDERLVRAIVTTNYDLTGEQTIGLSLNAIPGSPGFHYGGIAANIHPVTSPFGRDRSVDPRPRGAIPLLKLHGSLNWSLGATEDVHVFADLRPAFRGRGDAAIIPPLPEKHVPRWLVPVWDRAAAELRDAREWVVVGYSLPPYDLEIESMFRHAGRRVRRVRIYDPAARAIGSRWAKVAPQAEIELHDGLAETRIAGAVAAPRLTRAEAGRRRVRAEGDYGEPWGSTVHLSARRASRPPRRAA
jgi:hypothetical protein